LGKLERQGEQGKTRGGKLGNWKSQRKPMSEQNKKCARILFKMNIVVEEEKTEKANRKWWEAVRQFSGFGPTASSGSGHIWSHSRLKAGRRRLKASWKSICSTFSPPKKWKPAQWVEQHSVGTKSFNFANKFGIICPCYGMFFIELWSFGGKVNLCNAKFWFGSMDLTIQPFPSNQIFVNLGSVSRFLGVPLVRLLVNSIIYAAHSSSTLVAGTCRTWTSPNIWWILLIFSRLPVISKASAANDG